MSDEKLERIEAKTDRHTELLSEYNTTLVRLTTTVEHHVRRTDLLEADIKPIKAHVQFLNNTAKLISLAVAGLLALRSLGLL
jgi:hypothetical protein